MEHLLSRGIFFPFACKLLGNFASDEVVKDVGKAALLIFVLRTSLVWLSRLQMEVILVESAQLECPEKALLDQLFVFAVSSLS